jgi:hypothetical protein
MLKALIIATAIFGFCPARASSQNEQFWGSSTEQLKGNLKVAERVANVPEKIAKQFSNKSLRVFSIDLDSDGKPDYIVVVDKEFQTCYFCLAPDFLDSELSVFMQRLRAQGAAGEPGRA